MYKGHSVGVVVPAYNEAGLVGDVILGLPEFVDRVYAIDDASTDGTWDEILRAARQHSERSPVSSFRPARDGTGEPVHTDGGQSTLAARGSHSQTIGRVRAFRHGENQGAGAAIKTGYLAALADDIDLAVTVDGDGQMDPNQMSGLLDPIVTGRADYAKGNRLLNEDYRREMPRFRLVGNSILTFLTKVSSGYWKTMDPQNGYTAISGDALRKLDVERMYDYYGYCNEILVKLNARGMRVADVEIPAVYGDEESNIQYSTYIRKVSAMLLRNFAWRLKVKHLMLDFHPLALFYLFGTLLLALGGMGAGWSLYRKLGDSEAMFLQGAVSLLIVALGVLCLLFAILFDMQASQDNEVQIRE